MAQVIPSVQTSSAPCREMETNRKRLDTDCLPAERCPIEFLTENGFSIMRLSEIDKSIPAVGLVHGFLVRDPDGFELEITVEVADGVAQALARRSRGHLTADSSYWVCCAERHLAEYLCEQEDYPADARLIVDHPSLDDLNLARRWGHKHREKG
jgi:hypothetical protein